MQSFPRVPFDLSSLLLCWNHGALMNLTSLHWKKIKSLEAECMEKNAWQVCHDVASRINGEPAPCGDMIAYVTQKTGIVHPKLQATCNIQCTIYTLQ